MTSNAEPVLRSLFCFNFYRGWRGLSEFYRKYLPEGISAQQSYLLELCKVDEGILVGEIAHQLEIEMSAVSGLLKRMEASGLVRREVAPQNRRQTLVYLTTEGEQLRSQVHTAMVVADKQLSKAIPKEDKIALMNVVDQIRVLIGEDG